MQALIMAGGKGTRLGSLTAEIPKPMILVGGKPVLSHQIENLKKNGIKDIILVIGHLGDKISNYFGDGSSLGVKISYFNENEPLGTGGALYYLNDKIKDDFILIYGDAFFDIDFSRMINFHKGNKSDITMFVHPNSHPYDSDIVVKNKYRVIGIDSKNNKRDYDYENLVNAGVYILPRKIIDYLDGAKKHIEDIIIEAIDDLRVFAYRSTEYIKDMGTPDRLSRVNRDFDINIPKNKNLSKKQKCIFLDRDGTINKHKDYIVNPDQLELLDVSSEAIGLINNSEYLCIVVTNQPVVARGDCTFEGLENIHKRLDTLLGNDGAYIDDLLYCPHHPHKGYEGEVAELKVDCECRKPGSGMFLDAKNKYNIDLKKSYIIGDSTLDVESGKRLGIKTILVNTGVAGGDKKYNSVPDFVAGDILEAVKIILKYKE